MNSNWSYSLERSNWVKIVNFLSCVTLKFDGWPWKTTGHLFYTTSSFVHHFNPLVNSNWSYSPETLNSGQKSEIFCPVWPWNFMDDLGKIKGTSSILHQALCIISKPWMNSNWSYGPETLNSGQNWQFYILCDLEIWRMTLKNNRALLQCCFKLRASFRSHQWTQTRVTVLKRPSLVQIDDFF